jgi:hypothetical protein
MSPRNKNRRQVQLDLFCERQTTPDWHQLPEDVRRRARILLARLLHSHRDARPGAARKEGVHDE